MKKKTLLRVPLVLASYFACAVHAGFLEMPDTSEVPEYEEGSMLLDLDIPSVRERNPNPEAGPRLNVKEFRLQGVVEFPELDITREALVARVESLRFELMEEDRQGETGYTEKELAELADLIGDIEQRTQSDHVESVDVQQLVFLIREQRRRRGVTLGMIETVADTITRYYRERGFMLAKAYIPKQHVRDGVVTLTLLLGELGKVSVENNKRYSDREIQSVFDDSIGKPVTNARIEERLYLINDLPGLAVRGFFQAGSQVGDTELNVTVLEENLLDSNLRIDNEGTESTGEYRAYLDFTVNNPWLIGGQLYFSGLSTFEPENSNYGAFRYNRHVLNPRWRSSIGYSTNAFTGGLDEISEGIDSGFSGESSVADASLSYIIQRSRTRNYSVDLKFTDIVTTIELGSVDSSDNNEDSSFNSSLNFNFDIVDEKRRLLHLGTVGVVRSSAEKANRETSSAGEIEQGDKSFFVYDYSMLGILKLPFTTSESRILFKSSGQYVGSILESVNRFALAGTAKARAFDVNRVYSDDGIYVGVDLFFPGPGLSRVSFGDVRLDKVIQPFVFFDYSYGISYPNAEGAASEKTVATLGDVGLGIKLNLLQNLKGSLTYGIPFEEDTGISEEQQPGSPETVEVEESSGKLYFSLQYSF